MKDKEEDIEEIVRSCMICHDDRIEIIKDRVLCYSCGSGTDYLETKQYNIALKKYRDMIDDI